MYVLRKGFNYVVNIMYVMVLLFLAKNYDIFLISLLSILYSCSCIIITKSDDYFQHIIHYTIELQFDTSRLILIHTFGTKFLSKLNFVWLSHRNVKISRRLTNSS